MTAGIVQRRDDQFLNKTLKGIYVRMGIRSVPQLCHVSGKSSTSLSDLPHFIIKFAMGCTAWNLNLKTLNCQPSMLTTTLSCTP